MLGAYNVNGAPCELLVEQDTLTWWPRTAQRPTGGGGETITGPSASPLEHLRRLSSEASSVILTNIGARPADGYCEEQQETSDIRDNEGRHGPEQTKRRIEFGQIVGLKWVGREVAPSNKSATKLRQEETGPRSDDNTGGRGATCVCDERSQVAGGPASTSKPATSDRLSSKFRLYYVRRNEEKSSGRLLKLKKISFAPLESPARQQQQDSANVSQDNSVAAADSVPVANSAIVGLYEQIEQNLELVRRQRPKRLLVFVNPYGGKGRALHLYKSKVRKVLELARVECELVVTKYANHARETIEDPSYPLDRFDGIVCVGGDGMFGELMNGLLFRCNRDKLLASELGSLDKRLSGSLSCSTSATTSTATATTETQRTTTRSSSSCATDLDASTGSTCDISSRNHHRHPDQEHPRHSHPHRPHQQHHLNQRQRNDHRHEQNDARNHHDTGHFPYGSAANSYSSDSHSSAADESQAMAAAAASARNHDNDLRLQRQRQQLKFLRSSLGGIGESFARPSIPVGVIGAGSTDANLFGFIGTNDTVSAALNIVLGNQIQIDVCSLHSIQDDRLLRFVSTFVAYGYFGDVIRESEKLRWLGPSRYDVTALNSLIKYRHYQGLVRILRSSRDGSPLDLARCHLNCRLCGQHGRQTSDDLCTRGAGNNNNNSNNNNNHSGNNKNHTLGEHAPKVPNSFSFDEAALAKLRARDRADDEKSTDGGGQLAQAQALLDDCDQFEIIEEAGPFVGVNAAVTACRCPQTRKGFSPGNHLANGCADLILVRPCSRMQYINYLIRTGYTKKSAFDLKYVEAHRCRQFEFIVERASGAGAQDEAAAGDPGEAGERWSTRSSWNADGEILREQSLRVKVNNRLLRVFGTGEPQRHASHKRKT